MLGIIPIFIKIKNRDKVIASSLAFASGVMICVSITDLVPESIHMLKDYFNGPIIIMLSFLFIVLGIIISSLIDKYLPKANYQNLYRVGIISMLAIILHNIPEDCSCYVSQ